MLKENITKYSTILKDSDKNNMHEYYFHDLCGELSRVVSWEPLFHIYFHFGTGWANAIWR